MNDEQKLVYDELIRQGHTEENARVASGAPGSLVYAQARFSAHGRNLLMTGLSALTEAQQKIAAAWKRALK